MLLFIDVVGNRRRKTVKIGSIPAFKGCAENELPILVDGYELDLVEKLPFSSEELVELNSAEKMSAVHPLFERMLELADETCEYVYIVGLNTGLKPVMVCMISKGSSYECTVNKTKIIQAAVMTNSHNIVMIHNHPSGSRTPSIEDEMITKEIGTALGYCGITLLDHLIITQSGYSSIRTFNPALFNEFDRGSKIRKI